MTISKDEREAREWFAYAINKLRTILALLDRRVMPAPDEVPDEVLNKMQDEWYRSDINGGVGCDMMRAAYRALYDHYHQPPKPVKVEAWLVQDERGRPLTVLWAKPNQEDVDTSRIVHLREVEAEHD